MNQFEQQVTGPSFIIAIVIPAMAVLLTDCKGSSPQRLISSTGEGTCASPVVLSGAKTLDSESTSKASDTVSGEDQSCVGYKTHGSDRVYKITVPSKDKTKLSVTVIPIQKPGPAAYDPVVYVTEDCSAQPTCSSGSDSRGGGSPEAVQYVNTTGKDKDVYVVVDGYDYQKSGGDYNLVAEFVTP